MIQKPFNDQAVGAHDSIQYHFFFPENFIAFRIFRTNSQDYCSAWSHGPPPHETRYLIGHIERSIQRGKPYLDIKGAGFRIRVPDSDAFLEISQNGTDSRTRLDCQVQNVFSWLDPAGDPAKSESVIHQPNLLAELHYNGKKITGRGYCKRYFWPNAPKYCVWNFLHGVCLEENLTVWTADAQFGTGKYNYFKILRDDETLLSSSETKTYHQFRSAYGEIDDKAIKLAFKERGSCECDLSNQAMSAVLRQDYGAMALTIGENQFDCVALHENFIGSIA